MGKTGRGGVPTPKAPGGKRKGAGRKTDAFIERCNRLANSPKFFAWAEQVLAGANVEPRMTAAGTVTYVPASTHDRKELWKDLAAYAKGKPATVVDVKNPGEGAVSLIFLPQASQ